MIRSRLMSEMWDSGPVFEKSRWEWKMRGRRRKQGVSLPSEGGGGAEGNVGIVTTNTTSSRLSNSHGDADVAERKRKPVRVSDLAEPRKSLIQR
ncbi:hypothetical protein GE21DRAFT_1306596 [Neurospora crassa]|nr:hypothetical protein GE21DRAFT_1306596 [Neurospora crassa]